jgi:hypothetical protein
MLFVVRLSGLMTHAFQLPLKGYRSFADMQTAKARPRRAKYVYSVPHSAGHRPGTRVVAQSVPAAGAKLPVNGTSIRSFNISTARDNLSSLLD